MPEFNEGSNSPAGGPEMDVPGGKPCDWKNCDKRHRSDLKYRKGNVGRQEKALRQTLLGRGLEPWQHGNYFKANKPMYTDWGTVIAKATYRIQAHHLIPVEQMKETTTLKQNAVLAGWNIDDAANGMFLPQDEMDVAVHELQQHYGSHCGDYTKPIADRLKRLEQTFESMCHGKEDVDSQLALAQRLDVVAEVAKRRILAIRLHSTGGRYWPLHNDSLKVFIHALTEYTRRQQLNESSA